MRRFRFSAQSITALQNNSSHMYALRHSIQIYNSKSIYSMIPKNACSTMRLSISMANGCINNFSQAAWIHQNNTTFMPNLETALTAKFTFCILRCPFTRLASCFLDKFASLDVVAWNYLTLVGRNIDILNCSFKDFVKTLSKKNILNGNSHWRPQIDHLLYSDYDEWYDFSDFKKIKNSLSDLIDLDIVDSRPYIKHDQTHFKKITGNFSSVPLRELCKLKLDGIIPEYSSMFDNEIIAHVRSIYDCDIKLCAQIFGKNFFLF